MLENISPAQTSFTLPSGVEVSIRETNGEDEAILSKIKFANDNTSVPRYLVNIITQFNGGVKPQFKDLQKWLVNDIYYTMFKSRMFSIGNTIVFSMGCNNPDCPECKKGTKVDLEEDLSKYDWDLKTEPPTKEDSNYFEGRITKYAQGQEKEVIFTTASLKTLKFNRKLLENEKVTLDMPQDEMDLTTQLTVRDLSIKINAEWQKVGNFKIFTSREMAEIRKKLSMEDTTWSPMSEFVCPNCKNVQRINILAQPDFFFPGMI